MDGARRLWQIPASERRIGDGRFLRLPKPTDGPFYPLDTITLPPIRQTQNAYFTAPYKSDHELRELDIIHLSCTITATIWYLADSILHSEMKEWMFYQQCLAGIFVLGAYSVILRYFCHYFSDFVGFEWHLERPLWGKGGMEHFGFVGFWRLGLFIVECWEVLGKGVHRRVRRQRGGWRRLGGYEMVGGSNGCPAGCRECEADMWDECLGDGFRRERQGSEDDKEEDTESDDDDDNWAHEDEEGNPLLRLHRLRHRKSLSPV
ncbi:hypothetical protein TWF730_008952 [Orbilia blumenaviensis]|uniref:Uncharacterized protein n=1 Tax=Orbilia blumenaviensis TaxID=1796055 RepID=A0AAV9UWZ4_9PEZI